MRCGRCGAPLSVPAVICPTCGLPTAPGPGAGETVEWITEPERRFHLPRLAYAVAAVSLAVVAIAVTLVVTTNRHGPGGTLPTAQHGVASASTPSSAQPRPPQPPTASSSDVADTRLVADAGTMAGMLGTARQLRQTVAGTIARAAACQQTPDAAADALRGVLSTRLSLEQQLGGLSVESSLAPVAGALTQALATSDTADWDFVGWLDHAGDNPCAPATGTDTAYQRGLSDSQLATNAKQAFADRWNPLASQLDLTRIDPNAF
jgi:hypothetical protein